MWLMEQKRQKAQPVKTIVFDFLLLPSASLSIWNGAESSIMLHEHVSILCFFLVSYFFPFALSLSLMTWQFTIVGERRGLKCIFFVREKWTNAAAHVERVLLCHFKSVTRRHVDSLSVEQLWLWRLHHTRPGGNGLRFTSQNYVHNARSLK